MDQLSSCPGSDFGTFTSNFLLRRMRLHRFGTAFLAAFAFWASSVEVLLPELHDGDGEAQVAVGTVSLNSTVAGVAHVEEMAAQHTRQPTPDQSPLSHHGPHVDHCGHSHGATVGSSSRASVPLIHQSVPQTRAAALTSVELPQRLRPPIV